MSHLLCFWWLSLLDHLTLKLMFTTKGQEVIISSSGKQALDVFCRVSTFPEQLLMQTEQFILSHTVAFTKQLPSSATNWKLHTNEKHTCKHSKQVFFIKWSHHWLAFIWIISWSCLWMMCACIVSYACDIVREFPIYRMVLCTTESRHQLLLNLWWEDTWDS